MNIKRADLQVEKETSDFLTEHLLDVIRMDDGNIKVHFDTDDFPLSLTDPLSKIKGLKEVNYDESFLLYEDDNEIIKNNDVIAIMKDVKNLLKSGHININRNPVDYYQEMMILILEVGSVYSSFVELLFANMLVVDYENRIFWRYNQHLRPTFKLGDKSMASYINPLLGLLYQPNKNSIDKIDLDINLNDLDNDEKLTIYEKIFLNKL